MNIITKTRASLGLFLAALFCMAASAQAGVLDAAVVDEIETGTAAAIVVLTAGVTALGAFIGWRLIKRAGNRV